MSSRIPRCPDCGEVLEYQPETGHYYCNDCQKERIPLTQDGHADPGRRSRRMSNQVVFAEIERDRDRKLGAACAGGAIVLFVVLLLVLVAYQPILVTTELPRPPGGGGNLPSVVAPTPGDIDGDGVTNTEEQKVGSNPTDPEDAREGLFFFDGTGENYRGSAGRTEGGITSTGYVVTRLGSSNPLVEEVVVPSRIMARFGLRAVIHGTIVFAAPGVIKEIHPSRVADHLEPTKTFVNVALNITSVGFTFGNHTYGVSTNTSEPLGYVSFDRKASIFTDVTVSGVLVPRDFLKKLKVLTFVVDEDDAKFRKALPLLKVSYLGGARMVFSGTIQYKDLRRVEGDVLSVLRRDDPLPNSLGPKLPKESWRNLWNMTKEIGQELLVLADHRNSISNLTFWIIVAPSTLTREELFGVVTLPVGEAKRKQLEENTGTSADTGPASVIHIRYGFTGQEELDRDLPVVSVRELWSMLAENTRGPKNSAVAGAYVTCFAYVGSYRDIAGAWEKAFGDGTAPGVDLANTLNPGAAILLDENFSAAFDKGESLTRYLALAVFPNFTSDEEGLAFLTIRGALWDIGRFAEKPVELPLLLADQVVNATPEIVDASLEDLGERPGEIIQGHRITHIRTDGFVTGTTVRTVAPIALPFAPEAYLVAAHTPFDAGIYELSATPNGTTYHTAMLRFSILTGPTYFGRHVVIKGFWVATGSSSSLVNTGQNLTDPFGPDSLLGTLLRGLRGALTPHKFLGGFLLGYNVTEAPVFSVEIKNLKIDNALFEASGVDTVITGDLVNHGDVQFRPQVRIVVTGPAGGTTEVTGEVLHQGIWQVIPQFLLKPGDAASFRIPIHIVAPVTGNYSVDVLVIEYPDAAGYAGVLGEATTEFWVLSAHFVFGTPIVEVTPVLVLQPFTIDISIDTPLAIRWVKLHYQGLGDFWDQSVDAHLDGLLWTAEVPAHALPGTLTYWYEVRLEDGITVKSGTYEVAIT